MASNDLQGYKIQGIYYLNKRTHRIQQNVGGACPLLALCNTLFLNHQIVYAKGGRRIKFEELTDCLTQHLQNLLTDDQNAKTELEVDKDLNPNNLQSILDDTDPDIDDDDDVDVVDPDDVVDVDIDDDDDNNNNKPKSKNKDKTDKTTDKSSAKPTSDQATATDKAITNKDTPIKTDKNADQKDDKTDKKDADNDNNDKKDDPLDNMTEKERETQRKIEAIEECVKLFPKLEDGLDINIKFSDACDFEENPGFRMFNSYGFKLYHGWVVDPKQEKLFELIGEKSYDETIDFLISDPPKDATDDEKKASEADKDVVRKFFAESATQLTAHGLSRLYTLITIEDELNIFFRNNHFSTIVKHQGILYEFVTDEGIVDADPQITWQTLLQISGDEQFVNNKFQSIHNNMGQQSQIQQYNRLKYAQDNNLLPSGGAGGDGTGVGSTSNSNLQSPHLGLGDDMDDKKYDNKSLIGILDRAIEYIDEAKAIIKSNTPPPPPKQTIKYLSDINENTEPLLIKHKDIERNTDTFDKYMCKDYIHGIPLINDTKYKYNIRSFELTDARDILYLLSLAHYPNIAMKSIDFLYQNNKYGLIVEIPSIKLRNKQLIKTQKQSIQSLQSIQSMDDQKDAEQELEREEASLLGYIQYDWHKFNFWDWRDSDWDDYDIEQHIYSNNKFEKQKELKESGVRYESFVRIIDLAVLPDYNHQGLGSQLLKSLIYSFPSGTKFGTEVSTDKPQSVKCFSKIGFVIARMEQLGSKYKMTMESKFTQSDYQQFLFNSCVTKNKVINISRTQTSVQAKELKTITSNVIDSDFKDKEKIKQQQLQSQSHQSHPSHPSHQSQSQSQHHVIPIGGNIDEYDDDDDDINNTNLSLPDNMQRISAAASGSRSGSSSSSGSGSGSGLHGYASHPHSKQISHDDDDDDDDDNHYDDDTDDDDGIGGQQDIHDPHDPQDPQDPHDPVMGAIPQQAGGGGGGGHMHGQQGGGGGGQQDPIHGIHGGMDNMQFFYRDNLVESILQSLDLGQYYVQFLDLQITTNHLLTLEEGIVEFLIDNKSDRDKFITWLKDYKDSKTQQLTQQPTIDKQPQQQQPQQPQPSDDITDDHSDAMHLH